MPKLKRALTIILLISSALITGIVVFAPQISILLREGFPSEVWDGTGRYARVDGEQREDTKGAPALPTSAQTRFDDTGGRAMLVDQSGTLVLKVMAKVLSQPID